MRNLNRTRKGLGAAIAALAAATALMACAPPGPYMKAAHVRQCSASSSPGTEQVTSETSSCRHPAA